VLYAHVIVVLENIEKSQVSHLHRGKTRVLAGDFPYASSLSAESAG